jgi:nucleoside-diphosphate-sugar epimerase
MPQLGDSANHFGRSRPKPLSSISDEIAIVGATSSVGRFLAERFQASGIAFHAIGRQTRRVKRYHVHSFDDALNRFDPPIKAAGAVINCAPLPIIDRVMDIADCLQAKRIIAFGSTGRFSKTVSSSPIEQSFVNQQIQAEQRFEALSRQRGIAWTLFRPTMIYGGGSDLNVAFIGSFIRKFGFFPVPQGARGLRQPVHADDLARACLAALTCRRTFARAYDLGGADRLTYPELVERIFRALNKRPMIVPLPLQIFKLMVGVVRKVRRYRFINADMVDRMLVDLIADNSDAVGDFGYSPRRFFPTFADIYETSSR